MASAAYDSETLRLMAQAVGLERTAIAMERARLQLQVIGDDGTVFDHCQQLGRTTVLSVEAYLGLARHRLIYGDDLALTVDRLDGLAEDARERRITDRDARYFWPL